MRGMTTTAALASAAAAAKERWNVPGAAVGVSVDGSSEIWCSGVASVEHPTSITTDTRFRVFSISKSLVAVAAMRLVERGRLDLGRPVRDYVPELRLDDPQAEARLTVRHLLSHRTGWADTADAPPCEPISEIVGIVGRLPSCRPFEEWSYSNSGLMLAGHVLERVSGQPFEQVVDALVLEPLGMDASTYDLGELITHPVAIGHVSAAGAVPGTTAEPVVVRPWRDTEWSKPSIGLATTVGDLLRYTSLYLDGGRSWDGREVLSPSGVDELVRPQTSDGRMALTWLVHRVDGLDIVSLGGAGLGFGASVAMVPARRFAIVVTTNIAGHAFDREVTSWALAHHLGIDDSAAPAPLVPAASLVGLEGRYTCEHGALELRVTSDGLVAAQERTGAGAGGESGRPPIGGDLPLLVGEDDTVFVPTGPRAGTRGRFVRDDGGDVVGLRLPTILYTRS